MQDESEAMKSVILIDVEGEFKECNFKANASFKSYFNWFFCLYVKNGNVQKMLVN